MEPSPLYHTLQPGTYKILNDFNPEAALDLSGQDMKTVIGYGHHGGANQKWEIERLGPGYSIRSHLNGGYVTLHSGILEGCTMICTRYPVSWAIEPDDFDAGIYRIRWPDTPFIFDLPGGEGRTIQLSNRYPFQPTRLWRFVAVKATKNLPDAYQTPNSAEFMTTTSKTLESSTKTSPNQTHIKGLTSDGNDGLSITTSTTTTTTTMTTNVTTMKKIGPL